MPKKYLFIILVSLVCISSCTRRPKEVLSSSKMTKILVDQYTLDGIFTTDSFRHIPNNEKARYYENIFHKYHITQAEFDSSLIWYSHDPKKLEKIYIKVVDQLTQREADVKAGKFHPITPGSLFTTKDLWNDSTHYTLMGSDTARNQLQFVIKDSMLMTKDVYTLRFIHRINTEDSCSHPYIDFRIHYHNGQVDSIHHKTHHDGQLRRYTLQLPAMKSEKVDSLSGIILGSDSCRIKQNANVDSIQLIRKFNPNIQDSLRLHLQKQNEADTVRLPDVHKKTLFQQKRMELEKKQ